MKLTSSGGFLVATCLTLLAQTAWGGATAIPTFACMSLEWPQPAGSAATVCAVEYRVAGAGSWTAGHPLMWDGIEKQYRGSVVGLTSGTSYEFRLSIPGQAAVTVSQSTWSDSFPIATETVLPAGTISSTYLINSGGTASGWKLYKAHPSGTIIDVGNAYSYCVDIQASFVILKGVTMRNAMIHGMRIGNVSDVVVEGCDIANWGRPEPGTSNPVLQWQLDSGIYAGGANSQRLVFQGNKIGPPRYTANDWTQYSPVFGNNHPQGAKAIYLVQGLVGGVAVQGNHVIRWNDIAGDATHKFNDLLFESDGWTNPSPGNGLARDSDIYGNNLGPGCVDDGMELERGTRNIRIWGNYFDQAGLKAFSVRAPWHGPYYIFRNVLARPYTVADPSLLTPPIFFAENCQYVAVGFGKGPNGYPSTSPDGPKERGMGYFYHNTTLGIPGASFNVVLLKPNSETPTGNTPADTYYRLRNNIWQTEKFRLPLDYAIYQIPSAAPYIDYDLITGIVDGAGAAGAHLITGTAIFAAGSPVAIAGTGNYQPATNCPGVNQGEVIPNFNDGYAGGAPDLGAMEVGSSAFVAGRSLLVSAISPPPPTITTPPANALVYASLTATFSVTAAGSPPLVYQWYTNNVAVGGATGTTYTTPSTTTNESGTQFKVTVTNAYGAVTSAVATLTVLAMPPYPPSATGGMLTNYTLNGTNYWAHLFTDTGSATSFTPSQALTNVEVLVVAGGGGGGSSDNGNGAGGGGGAGGLIYRSLDVAVGNHAVTVGAGGAANGGNGADSAFGSLTALGGGGGQNDGSATNSSGGSGGGGKGRSAGTGASATQPGSTFGGYGNNGGNGALGGATGGGGGGGGGGAESIGANAAVSVGGNGGGGKTYDISGSALSYAGGGGGGGDEGFAGGTAWAGGGAGGSGSNPGTDGASAAANTGSGGGGGGSASSAHNGGAGGSGIVIVRYVAGVGTSTYTVAYHANGATSGSAPSTQTKTNGIALTLAANSGNLANTGYTFAGWNTAADGSGASYAEGASYTADASATLYAKWTANAQAPAITTNPASITVTAGQSAAFRVTASGTAPLSYQWYKDAAPIGGATASSYTTPATTTNDNEAAFKVIVTNAYGAATSSVAMLTVNAAPTGGVSATGGTVTNYTLNGTNYTAHIFTSIGTGNLDVSAGGKVEVLVVGGGGAGGQGDNGDGAGGGGGAGGLIYTNVTLEAGSNYTVVVGSGGDTNTAANGSSSVFGSSTALGGGYGGRMGALGATNGGCGGGGSGRPGVTSAGSAIQPGSSSGGYGNNGGAGVSSGGGGGGGGAGSAGVAGGSGSTGGNGFTSSVSGVETVYAGGGGGGSGTNVQAAGTATGGGGAGGAYGQNNGFNAVANTGGGGGGGGEAPSAGKTTYGGRGGSGIVIVRYVTAGGVVNPDADGNGLPDAWETQHFGGTSTLAGAPAADADGDGLSNLQEYQAGTDPTNRLSVLCVSASEFYLPSSECVIRWQSATNKCYTVQAATNLVSGFGLNLRTNIPATPPVNVLTDNVGTVDLKLYRIRVE